MFAWGEAADAAGPRRPASRTIYAVVDAMLGRAGSTVPARPGRAALVARRSRVPAGPGQDDRHPAVPGRRVPPADLVLEELLERQALRDHLRCAADSKPARSGLGSCATSATSCSSYDQIASACAGCPSRTVRAG